MKILRLQDFALPWPTKIAIARSIFEIQGLSGSGHKFERTKVRIAKKVQLLSSPPNQPSFYTVLNIYPEYMYDVPLSPEPCI